MSFALLGLSLALAAIALHSLGCIFLASFGKVQFRNMGWLYFHAVILGVLGAASFWLLDASGLVL